MKRIFGNLGIALMVCAAAHGAVINTTITVTNANVVIGASIVATGTVVLTNIGSGPFTSTIAIGATALTGPFTITLAGGNITGTLSLPSSILFGTASTATGSVTVTGGTGAYAGATGSFPAVVGSGTLTGTTAVVSFSGSGTITTGGGTTPTGPVITSVVDAAGYTAGLGQGGIFVIKGSNLAPSGVKVFDIPRPTTSPDGVKVTFTSAAGGSGTDAILYYTYNQSGTTQLSGILPSTIAPGNYNVTVTNGTVSPAFSVPVLKNKFGLFTQDQSGSGLASVQNFISQQVVDLNSFTSGNGKSTTISPAKPGQFMIAYGTGLGPLVGGDNAASPVYDFNANGVSVKAVVGGVSIPALFAGRAGYAGEDQINFQLPANVPTGCTVSFQISVDNVLSNPTFIAIADSASATTCTQPGYTAAQLQNFDNGASITAGYFTIEQFSTSVTIPGTGTVNAKFDAAAGAFSKITGFQLAASGSSAGAVLSPTGACTVSKSVTTSASTGATGTVTNLDAGNVTLSGPTASGLTNSPFTQDATNEYVLSLGIEANGLGLPTGLPGFTTANLAPGLYTVKGNGGKDVGAFTASVNLGAPLAVTLPTTITRSNGVTLNWTGGNANDFVEIIGSSSTTSGTGTGATTTSTSFVCTTTAGVKTFTVPASVLQQLPASTAGSLTIFTGTNLTGTNGTFSAPLTAGGTVTSTFAALNGVGGTPIYQ